MSLRPTPGAAIAITLLAVGGCYSFSARTSTHIRSVAVPFFENRSGQFGLEGAVTEAVAKGFLDDGDLRVVDERSADSVLRGVITGYDHKAAVYDQREQVSTMRVTITADISYRDLTKNTVVWEQQALSAWGQYRLLASGEGPAQTEEDGQVEAIRRLVQEILARSIETW